MRRQHTLIAMAAMTAALASGKTSKGFDPNSNGMGHNTIWMSSKSQRVKNKLNRKRYA